MCGLVGAFGSSLYSADEEFFKDGLIASQLRGQDSTGLAVVNGSGKRFSSTLMKSAQDASMFVARKDVQKVFEKNRNIKVMMGHTRWATQGSVCDTNAHPFEHEHIVMAHNGSIWNKKDLPEGDKFQVDSEAICHSIAKIGAIETLRKINGAFALSYYDLDQHRFNLIRNEGRPLFYAKHKHRQAYYYASEGEMLLWILRRNKIDIDVSGASKVGIYLLEDSHLASFDYKNDKFEIREVNYEKEVPAFELDKPKWHHPGARESVTEEKTHPNETGRTPASGGNSQSGVGTVIPITSRRGLPPAKMSDGPHGSGAEYLNKWGLKFFDTVMVYIPSCEPVSPKSYHCRALAYFGGDHAPDCDIWVHGFTEKEYEDADNDHGRYFSNIQCCWWDENTKSYTIGLSGVFSRPPGSKGEVAIPKDRWNLFVKHEVKSTKPHIKLKTELPALPPPKDSIHLDKNSENDVVLTEENLMSISEAAAADHAALEASFRTGISADYTPDEGPDPANIITDMDKFVLGPAGSSITRREWLRKTKDGCGYCDLPLELETTVWIGESPCHTNCESDVAELSNRQKRTH